MEKTEHRLLRAIGRAIADHNHFHVGVGAGYGWVNRAGLGVSDQGIALGATVGASLDMTSNLALDVGYHFRDTMISGDDAIEHSVTAGLRFKF